MPELDVCKTGEDGLRTMGSVVDGANFIKAFGGLGHFSPKTPRFSVAKYPRKHLLIARVAEAPDIFEFASALTPGKG
jgi:hypothetical protein